MARPKAQESPRADLVFSAYNRHTESCGAPPEIRNTDAPGLYHGYYENRHGEQFVLTFDPRTKSGMISGGDLSWNRPFSFTLSEVEAALWVTQELATKIMASAPAQTPPLPTIDAALALGRLAGLTSDDEVMWLRACLKACANFADLPANQGTA